MLIKGERSPRRHLRGFALSCGVLALSAAALVFLPAGSGGGGVDRASTLTDEGEYLFLIYLEEEGSLADLADLPLVFRYVGMDFLIAQGSDAGLTRLGASGAGYRILDHPLREAGYFLVLDPRGHPVPGWAGGGAEALWSDNRGVALFPVADPALPLPVNRGLTTSLLPHSMSLRSYLPHEPPSPLSPLLERPPRGVISEALLPSRVSALPLEERLRQHILGLSWDEANQEYRSRYAYRPEVRDSAATYVRQAFLEALGGRGEVTYVEGFPCGHEDSVSIGPNIVARLPGLGRGEILLTAHYDATGHFGPDWDWRVHPAPGADDNATGVAALIEILRYVAPLSFEFDLVAVAFACEEITPGGLWGSRAYAEAAAARGDTIWGVINLDMIGFNPDEERLEVLTNVGSQWLADWLLDTGGPPEWPGVLEKKVGSQYNRSDHASFWGEGYDAVLIIENSDPEINPFYHTIGDTLGNISLSQVAAAVRMVAGALSALANLPTPDLSLGPGSVRARWPGYPLDWYPDAGDTVSIEAAIRNLGRAMAEEALVAVRFFARDAEGREDFVGGHLVDLHLLQGEQFPAGAQWVVPSDARGEVTLLARLEAGDRRLDFDPGNNESSTTVVVHQEDLALFDAYAYPNPASTADGFHLHFQLSHEADVTVTIFSLDGTLLASPRTFFYRYGPAEERTSPGVNEFTWEAIAGGVSFPASGLYLVRLAASKEGGGGATSVFLKLAVRR